MPRPARPWYRVYSEALDNPKLQRLSGNTFKAWFNIACLANVSEPRGTLPAVKDIAFRLRLSEKQAGVIVRELAAVRLLDETPTGYAMHDWDGPNGWQYESDARATEGRQKRGDSAAESPQNYGETLSDAPPRADTEQKQNRTETDPDTDEEAPQRRNIFVLYDNFMGKPAVTAQMRDILIEAESTYPANCIEHCFTEAAASSDGRRSWRFVESILIRHQTEGCNGRPRQLQTAGRSTGRRQNSGDDIAAAWEDYERRQRES